MNTVRIVKQNSEFSPDNGDIIHGNRTGTFAPWIRQWDSDELKRKNFLKLGYFGLNNWTALTKTTVDLEDIAALELSACYDCPFTNRSYHGLLPIGIVTDNCEQYFGRFEDDPWYKEMACDKSWNVPSHAKLIKDLEKADPATTGIVLMGPGYTEMCYPNDGNWDRQPALIDLDNGDKIVCFIFVWYNK